MQDRLAPAEMTLSELRTEALLIAGYADLTLVKVNQLSGFTCLGDNWEILAYAEVGGAPMPRGIGALAEDALDDFYQAILAY